MTFEPSQARYALPFAGKDYDVTGTFQLISDIEWELKASIVNVMARTIEMPVREFSKLLTVILTKNGHNINEKEVSEKLWLEVGIGTPDYFALTMHVSGFLSIMVAKPDMRTFEEKKTKDSIETYWKTIKEASNQAADSLGENTSKSA